MERNEEKKQRFFAWAKRTGYDFGRKRAGGSLIPDSAIEHMKHTPYGGNYRSSADKER